MGCTSRQVYILKPDINPYTIELNNGEYKKYQLNVGYDPIKGPPVVGNYYKVDKQLYILSPFNKHEPVMYVKLNDNKTYVIENDVRNFK